MIIVYIFEDIILIMKKRFDKLFISSLITVSVIILLIVAGPAQAFILQLSIPDKDVTKGENITFIASTTIEDQEVLNISHFIFELNGPKTTICKFSPQGKVIEGCEGITIEQISSIGYGYGYGYVFSNGVLSYNITLNTSNYSVGIYKTLFLMFFDNQNFTQKGDKIIIRGKVDPDGSCSVRGNNGDITVNGTAFDKNNKINFYIPLNELSKGTGSLTSQTRRSRLSYDFKVGEILENNNNRLKVIVNGQYKINRTKPIKEEAVIMVNKKNKTIDIIGDNLKINDMNLTFFVGCEPL